MKLSQLQNDTQAICLQQNSDTDITHFEIDSRKIQNSETALFIAIIGIRNGHNYIHDCYNKGVRSFLVSENADYTQYSDASFLLVKDTLAALQQLATKHRQKYTIPIIGITGSNGKTIVKEWLFQLLNKDYKIVRSPKSYNSQIGVPLSVLALNNTHNLAIFEAGISQPEEMQHSASVIQPNIGIFTNIGEAHNSGFKNTKQKIEEKLKLFKNSEWLIYCSDYEQLDSAVSDFINKQNPKLKVFNWSKHTTATLQITAIESTLQHTFITAIYQNSTIQISIPFTDNASIENAINCWGVMLYLAYDKNKIAERFNTLVSVAMRLELKQGINNCTIINDTYNSDYTSFQIALDYLDQQKQHAKKTVILSDMFQIGIDDEQLYKSVAKSLFQKNIQRFIGIGNAINANKHYFTESGKMKCKFYKSSESFFRQMHKIPFDNEAILLKGARHFKFEKIEKLLQQKNHKTVLEINLSAMLHNLNVYRSYLSKQVKVMAMVKAYAYGSGSFEIANILQYAGVDYLAVAYIDEGISLRKAGITMPIVVLNTDIQLLDKLISWKLEPEIYNLNILNEFITLAKVFKIKHYPIHIKLDTGMHRLGFEEKDLNNLIALLKNNNYIKVESIFSHLAGSDSKAFNDFTALQFKQFNLMSEKIESVLEYKPIKHIANSAAIVNHRQLHLDMVRLGIGLYGIDSGDNITKKLLPTGTLKTTITQIKHLDKGETVGYSRSGMIHKKSTIAVVNIGYADGYPRILGNGKAYMLVNGQKAKIVGNVCMDMCMIDITDIPKVHEGDEVIVFGNALPITQVAQWANTIPYEILTNISQRVKRIYINE